MTVPEILASFARDSQVHAAIVLIVADVIFGMLAAFKRREFRLVRVADTLRDDFFFKVAPWFGLFALGKVSNADVVGIDFTHIADVAWAGVLIALGASILNSVRDLGVNLPEVVAGEGTTPHS